jgi:hypothetical protein
MPADPSNTESFNFFVAAAKVFVNREDMDLAVRDIVLRITQLVLENRDYSMVIECKDLGYMYISTRPLRFKLRLSRETVLPAINLAKETPEVKGQINENAKDHGLTVSSMLASDFGQLQQQPSAIVEELFDHQSHGIINLKLIIYLILSGNADDLFSNQSKGKIID